MELNVCLHDINIVQHGYQTLILRIMALKINRRQLEFTREMPGSRQVVFESNIKKAFRYFLYRICLNKYET